MSSAKGKRKTIAPAKFWTPARLGLTVAALIIVAAVASIAFRSNTAPAPAPASNNASAASRSSAALTALPTKAMEADIEMLLGEPVRLSSYNGKVLIVDLWATWCGPCRVEIPFLIDLAKEFKDRGLEVIGLTTENKATELAAVESFVKQFKINYPIGWANREISETLLTRRGGIPQTLVIGRDGQIRKHLVGFNARVSGPQLRTAVEEAVAE